MGITMITVSLLMRKKDLQITQAKPIDYTFVYQQIKKELEFNYFSASLYIGDFRRNFFILFF